MTTCLAEDGAPGIKRSFSEVATPQVDPVARGRIPAKFTTLTQNLHLEASRYTLAECCAPHSRNWKYRTCTAL